MGDKDRVTGLENQVLNFSYPLTPTLSLRERGLSGTVMMAFLHIVIALARVYRTIVSLLLCIS
jgi:hypothetical protein